jgi:hypothetical protein
MTDGVTIYQSDPDEAIQRLAQLDSARLPSGAVLVAAVGGEPRAALPRDGGRPIADPFRRTAELVRLLELRRAQLEVRPSTRRLARVLRPSDGLAAQA